MAKKRTVFSQLTSAGENALEQLTQSPVTRKAVESALQVKDRVEKMVSNLADIDGRVSKLEKRIEALEKAGGATATKARATATKARSSTSKPPSSSSSKS